MVTLVRRTMTARGSLVGSSLGLYLGKGLQLGAGFLFWVVAAHASTVTEIGVAVAAVSAVMLCTQLALLGTGSAVIVAIGRDDRPGPVLDTALTILAVAGTVIGGGYVAVTAGHGTSAVAHSPLFIGAFLVATVFGTAMMCLDQVCVALGRGGSSASRYAVGGLVPIVVLTILGFTVRDLDALVLFVCWSCGAVSACLLGGIQLHRFAGYHCRPAFHLRRARRLLGVGLPNQLLTLTERVPALLVPVLVAHTVSPETTAYWYPAWMMAWVVYTAPVQVGLVQFAEGVRRPDQLVRTVRSGIRWSLLMGGGIGVVLFAAAGQLLHLMGSEYSDASAGAVRVLVLGVVPYAVLQAYSAICRSRGRLGEGIVFGAVLGTVVCVAVVAVAPRGPMAMAVAWVGTFAVGAVWATIRLLRLLRERSDG
jgi:O-antigen/teichoic acid export membrane protein